jgi:Zn-dependent protease
MLALRQLLRWSFAIAAALFLPAGFASLLGLAHAANFAAEFNHGCIAAAFLLVSLLSAMAWWSTRNPRPAPSAWALAASAVDVAAGLVILRFAPGSAASAGSGLLSMVLGLTGLIVFSRRDAGPAGEMTGPAPECSTTPISWSEYASTALFLVAQIAAVQLWSGWVYSRGLPTSGVSAVFLIVLAALTTSAMHEAGHALAARAFHLELLKFHAGPFHWRSREGQWSFHFHAPGLLTLGGVVGIAPNGRVTPSPWQDLCVVAAGPVANICAGLLAMATAMYAQAMLPAGAWEFLGLIASFSLIAAVFNLFPFQSERGTHSDGARILQLLASGLNLAPAPRADLPILGRTG